MSKLVGLKNGKNLCHLNAAVQLLFSIDPIRRAVVDSDSSTSPEFAVLRTLFKAMIDAKQQSCSAFPLARILNINPNVQEDANESLLKLLAVIEGAGTALSDAVHASLYFDVNIRHICQNCEHEYSLKEKFSLLHVDVAATLQTAVTNCLVGELDGRDCSGCYQRTKARKELEPITPPPFLVIMANRFFYDDWKKGTWKKDHSRHAAGRENTLLACVGRGPSWIGCKRSLHDHRQGSC
jgi:uncharacterized UBP type Zn finger protein